MTPVEDHLATAPVVEVSGLSVRYQARGLPALDDISLSLNPRRRLGIVGESGSGKSTLGLALLGLLPQGTQLAGSVRLNGMEVIGASDKQLRSVRGAQIGMVFQDASLSLDPVRTVGFQLAEAVRAHGRMTRSEIIERSVELLTSVDVPRPADRLKQYPHQLSGGQRQRVMIAIALAADPRVLVADEPTSALDVTTQAGIVELLVQLSEQRNMATVLITHDVGVVAQFATDVLVLYGGRVMANNPVGPFFEAADHPYARALVDAVPRLDGPRLTRLPFIPGTLDPDASADGCVFAPRCVNEKKDELCVTTRPGLFASGLGGVSACHHPVASPLRVVEPGAAGIPVAGGAPAPAAVLEVHDIHKSFRTPGRGQPVVAVAGVSLQIGVGESVALVGESGSGKTTIGRIIVGLESADSGQVEFAEGGVSAQMIFQDPAGSLNPRMRIENILVEPTAVRRRLSRSERSELAEQLLADVQLPAEMLRRYPHQLSGGQLQRVAIARAIGANPKLIVADEAVSALDVSARGQILNLLADLQRKSGVAILHVSHDLSLVRHVADRVLVMRSGVIVETGPAAEVLGDPQDQYTQSLIAAIPHLYPPVRAAS